MINSTALAIFRAIESAPDDDDMTMLTIRDLLIDEFSIDGNSHEFSAILRECLAAFDTETLTELRLEYSLCPLHGIDYAICFDDDDPECAQIRAIHPSHDT